MYAVLGRSLRGLPEYSRSYRVKRPSTRFIIKPQKLNPAKLKKSL